MEKGRYHKDWYTEEPEKLKNLLPEFEGLPICEFFAITSMTTSIEANVHLAIKALLLLKRKAEFIGFLPAQKQYLNLITNGVKQVPGRKINNFIQALKGQANAIVVDIWMCKAFEVLKQRDLKGRKYFLAPSKKEYDAIELYCRDLAKKKELEGRQVQSMIWASVKSENSRISRNVTWSDILIKKKGMFLYE